MLFLLSQHDRPSLVAYLSSSKIFLNSYQFSVHIDRARNNEGIYLLIYAFIDLRHTDDSSLVMVIVLGNGLEQKGGQLDMLM